MSPAQLNEEEFVSRIDLHTHSTASDGTLTPTELVDHACSSSISLLAITDHDTMNGVEEFERAASKRKLDHIPGIEFGTDYPDGTLHILGYYLDRENPDLVREIEHIRQSRSERALRMIERLREVGISISIEHILQETDDGHIGRPHFAMALVRAGNCRDCQEAFDTLLGKSGPAYVSREKISVGKALRLVRTAGGFSSLSHPVLVGLGTGREFHDLVKDLVDQGLDGIEVFSPTHGEEASAVFLRIAGNLGLRITGGSDFHGEVKPEYSLGLDEKASRIIRQSVLGS